MGKMRTKNLLMAKFKDDPLYKYLILFNKEEELFTPEILSLEEHKVYSAIIAATVIKRSVNHIRYLLERLIDDSYIVDPYVGRSKN